MRRKSHVRFGGRAAETHPAKAGQGAAVRPLHHPHPDREWVFESPGPEAIAYVSPRTQPVISRRASCGPMPMVISRSSW
jgi:hypothetical protein